MTDVDKRSLSERDICTKYMTPALRDAGWDEMHRLREEVTFTKGRIIVRGKMVSRGKAEASLAAAGVRPERMLVLPFPFGVLWRVIALDGDDWLEGWTSLADGSDEMTFRRSPRGLDALAGIDDAALSAFASRLQWFSGGFFAAREIDDTLVLSDLGIGTNESPVFAFDVARRGGAVGESAPGEDDATDDDETGQGGWQTIVPVERQPKVDSAVFGRLARRVIDPGVEVDSGRVGGRLVRW